MSEALFPCPFCGETEKLDVMWVDWAYRGCCLACDAHGPRHAPRTDSEPANDYAAYQTRVAWNRRADLARQVKPLEWVEDEHHAMGYRENAQCTFGAYWIENHENSGEWRLYFDGHPSDCYLGGGRPFSGPQAFAR